MSSFDTFLWILTWYILVGGFIAFFLLFFRFINMPSWRDDHGDRSSEAGYFEDGTGRILKNPLDEEGHENGTAAPPHVQA